ncbi:MAG: type II toxin-antitoxin system VapC family toxin [Chloroflexi bacterium]|nr:type II toxin-antitoxin system VapC family toxin [Chloroflexota bacterium]
MRILDTDHCVAILRGRLDLQGRISPDEQLAVTAITVGELTHGAWRSLRASQNLAAVDTLLSAVLVLPFDDDSARRFGALKAALEHSGSVVADLDLQIASIALSHGAPLLTHNRQHFERIPDLQIEDWL